MISMQKDRVRQRRFERRSTPWKGAILTTRRLAQVKMNHVKFLMIARILYIICHVVTTS